MKDESTNSAQMRKSDLQLRFRIHKEYNTRGRP